MTKDLATSLTVEKFREKIYTLDLTCGSDLGITASLQSGNPYGNQYPTCSPRMAASSTRGTILTGGTLILK
jgi:hypothetical protein